MGTGSNTEIGARFINFEFDSYYLDSAEVAISHVEGVNQLTLSLHELDGSKPGNILESVTLNSITPHPTSELTTFHFSGTSLIEPITAYWLVATTVNDGNSWIGWNLNNTGAAGLASRQQAVPEWSVTNGPTPAMRINATIVPEPTSALFLFGTGTLACLRRRRH